MKVIALVIIMLSLQGCLKVEVKSPDGLVADTVKAGKDAYQSVSDSINGNKESTFTHQYYLASQDSQESATSTCLSEVKKVAESAIGSDNFDIRETITRKGAADQQAYIECKIIVVSQE